MPPPEARLELVWDGSPVNFTDTVSYVCTVQYSTVQFSTVQYTVQVSYVCSSGEGEEELFFEWDRDMGEYNVSCLEGGSWDQPAVWPVCLPC